MEVVKRKSVIWFLDDSSYSTTQHYTSCIANVDQRVSQVDEMEASSSIVAVVVAVEPVRSIAAVSVRVTAIVGAVVMGPASVVRSVVVLFRSLVGGFNRGSGLLGRAAVAVDADVRAGRVVAVAVTGGSPAVVMSRIVTVAMTPSGIAPVAVVTGGRLLVGDGGHGLLFRLVFGGHQGQHGQDNLKRNGGMSQYSIPEMVVEPFGLTAALRANFILEWNALVGAKSATVSLASNFALYKGPEKRQHPSVALNSFFSDIDTDVVGY